MSMTEEKRYAILEGLEVVEVSVVDRGANKRPLLVVKNAGAEMSTTPETSENVPTPDPVAAAQAQKAAQDTDLIVSLPTELRDGLSKMLGEVGQRVAALGEAVKATQPGEGGMSDKFKSEVAAVSTALRKMIGVEKSDDLQRVEKVFSDGYANPTPDYSAPEYVMTPDGPMMRLPMEAMKAIACKYASEMMWKAEDALFDGNVGGCCMAMLTCFKTIAPFAKADEVPIAMLAMLDKQYAFNQPQASIAAGVPTSAAPAHQEQPGSGSLTSPMAKAGRKISGERLSKLESMLAELNTMVSELRPDAADERTAPVAVDVQVVETMKSQVTELANLAKSQEAELKQLRSARPIGNAGPVEEPTNTPTGPVLWPDDLNDLDDADIG